MREEAFLVGRILLSVVFIRSGLNHLLRTEGSVQYAVTAFWSAVAYDAPVTFCVLRNAEYAILKWFGALEQVEGAPGLDLPALDVAATAESYGVEAARAGSRDELHDALEQALAADAPRVVEVGVSPGMALA